MSDLALIALLVTGAVQGGDSVADRLGRLARTLPERTTALRELDSLRRESEAIRRAIKRPRFALTDTLVARGVTVLVSRFERDAFAAALTDVAAGWERLFEGEPPAVVIEIRGGDWGPDRTLAGRYPSDPAATATAPLGSRLAARNSRSEAGRALGSVLGQLLLHRADTALARWLVVPPSPTGGGPPIEQMAYQLATTRGSASVACRDGDRSRCRMALGFERSSEKELPYSIRSAILGRALELGGQGGWSRLVARPDLALADRIGAVAGRDVDELFASWLADLRVTRQRAGWDDPIRWLAAVGWLVLALGAVVGGGLRR